MMSGPDKDRLAAVAADPRYHALVKRRTRLSWWLSGIVFFSFVGYLLLIAFDKPLLATPIAGGTTSLGIPIGFGLIVFTIALTCGYVTYANRQFDREMAEILAGQDR